LMARGKRQREGVVVGVLSDTHGHLYPEVRRLLQGVDHIIHAGDVGSPQVLADLRTIAPVTVVRGNCDTEAWAQSVPVRAEVNVKGARILVGHMLGRLRETAGASGSNHEEKGYAVVITGHTHLAVAEEREDVLYLNPGSAGPRRFGRPRTVARLEISSPAGTRAAATGVRPRIDATILSAESAQR
jgi:putative phosphoesterase